MMRKKKGASSAITALLSISNPPPPPPPPPPAVPRTPALSIDRSARPPPMVSFESFISNCKSPFFLPYCVLPAVQPAVHLASGLARVNPPFFSLFFFLWSQKRGGARRAVQNMCTARMRGCAGVHGDVGTYIHETAPVLASLRVCSRIYIYASYCVLRRFVYSHPAGCAGNTYSPHRTRALSFSK